MAEIKNIEVGKFYLIHDGSKTGHPGFVVWKDDNANRYLLVLTESDKEGNVSKRAADKRHLTDLDHPTEDRIVKSYIKKRPMLCKRKDIGICLLGMKFHPNDYEKVKFVAKQIPVNGPSLRK